MSVLIPTRGRQEKLCRALALLARQESARGGYEVLVGFDGPDSAGVRAARAAWAEAGGDRDALRVFEFPPDGYTLARNRLLREAQGRILLSINDDVRPCARFVAVHRDAQDEAHASGVPAIIVGHSPFLRPTGAGDTLLNRLARETGMVFFYDVMNAPEARSDRRRDWGFRHCFGLNFSASMDAVRKVGGFFARQRLYGYDDVELGFRLQERFGMPVLYRPQALAEHDHAYTPEDILARERSLGVAAWHVASANPAFGRAVFGRDITSAEEIDYSREFVERERAMCDRVRVAFTTLGTIPSDAISGPRASALITLVYQQHLALKRWTWREGLLSAADNAEQPKRGAVPAAATASDCDDNDAH